MLEVHLNDVTVCTPGFYLDIDIERKVVVAEDSDKIGVPFLVDVPAYIASNVDCAREGIKDVRLHVSKEGEDQAMLSVFEFSVTGSSRTVEHSFSVDERTFKVHAEEGNQGGLILIFKPAEMPIRVLQQAFFVNPKPLVMRFHVRLTVSNQPVEDPPAPTERSSGVGDLPVI